MTDNITSHNVDLSCWITLYVLQTNTATYDKGQPLIGAPKGGCRAAAPQSEI
jgi:hypothetical protein